MVRELGIACYEAAFGTFRSLTVQQMAEFVEYHGRRTRRLDRDISEAIHVQLGNYSNQISLASAPEDDPVVTYFGEGTRRRYTRFDPLDGTDNALSGIPISGFSMAITEETDKKPEDLVLGDFVNGFVGDMGRKRLFYKTTDNRPVGTDFNTEYQLRTSGIRNTRDGLICFDAFSPKSADKYDPQQLGELYTFLTREFRDLYRPRSAVFEAMSMLTPPSYESYVVAYVAPKNKTENVVGSIPVVSSAGGIVSDFNGNPLTNHSIHERVDIVMAANRFVHEEVLKILERYRP